MTEIGYFAIYFNTFDIQTEILALSYKHTHCYLKDSLGIKGSKSL